MPGIFRSARAVRLAALLLLVAWGVLVSGRPAAAQGLDVPQGLRSVHDPALIETDAGWVLFGTGPGIQIRCGQDLESFELCSRVFFGRPDWHRETVPGVDHLWAPDISEHDGEYRLYYSVSTFGSNRSAIGLATASTLDPDDPDYGWTDQGIVIASQPSDPWNAIDPNLALDESGGHWLAFGSFWSGIKLVRIDPATGLLADPGDPELVPLAYRPQPPHAVEAPFIVRRGDHYYLFVSFDQCCRGVDSTYNIRVGRAEAITGPYVDRDGTPMLEGGGTLLIDGGDRWRGPGHNAVIEVDGRDLLVYHAYDAQRDGIPTLRISPLVWEDGWPSVAML